MRNTDGDGKLFRRFFRKKPASKTETMENSSKRRHPLLAWVSFFLAFNLFIVAVVFGAVVFFNGYLETDFDIFQAAVPDVRVYYSNDYREIMMYYFMALHEYLLMEEELVENSHLSSILDEITNEISAGNLIVYAQNNATGKTFSINAPIDEFHRNGLLYIDGQLYYANENNADGNGNSVNPTVTLYPIGSHADAVFADTEEPRQIVSFDKISVTAEMRSMSRFGHPSYISLFHRDMLNPLITSQFSADTDITLYVLALNAEMIARSSYTPLSNLKNQLQLINLVYHAAIGFAVLLLTFALYAYFKRDDRIYANRHIALVLRHMWIEVKLLLYIFICLIFFAFAFDSMGDAAALLISCLATYWCVYLLAIDMRHNGIHQCWSNNIAMSIKRQFDRISFRYNVSLQERPLIRAIKRKFINYLIFAGCDVGLFMLSLISMASGGGFMALCMTCGFAALGVYVTKRYVANISDVLYEVSQLSDKIISIKNGVESPPLAFPVDSLLRNTAYALNDVQTGIKAAVEEQMKSERMKIELVTNVSHDIKTPLTSLVSYTELLSQCDDMPDEASDYVRILRDKLRRLTELIGNLFELSKATSNQIEIVREEIDLRKLIYQVDAEFSDKIEMSNLKFIYNIPDTPVMLFSDGAKLHRVLENLYINALKYSLEGSRVYLTLSPSETDITFSMSNISREEIDYTADEIMARFVRGDKNRSTEGSGLGLAIARSFTELCGGTFTLLLDGDVFKAVITFPPPLAQSAAPLEPYLLPKE